MKQTNKNPSPRLLTTEQNPKVFQRQKQKNRNKNKKTPEQSIYDMIFISHKNCYFNYFCFKSINICKGLTRVGSRNNKVNESQVLNCVEAWLGNMYVNKIMLIKTERFSKLLSYERCPITSVCFLNGSQKLSHKERYNE